MSDLPRDSQYPGASHALLEQAEAQFRAAIALAPQTPDALRMLGAAAREAGLHSLAHELLDKLFSTHSNDPLAYRTLGCLQRDQGAYDQAIASFHRGIALNSNIAEIHADLADALRRNGELAESLQESDHALSLDPGRADSHYTHGNTLYHLGQFNEALSAFGHALSLNPEHAAAHRNVAVIHFLHGDFLDAYPHYEWRWKATGFRGTLESLNRPFWNGEPLGDQTLLLHAEQGLGDTLQFVRYVPLIDKKDARIILQVQSPLKRLLSEFPGVDVVVSRGDELPSFDVQCPLLSLPRIFQTRLETIPNAVPYRLVRRSDAEKWPRRKNVRPSKRRVGIAWAGNSRHSGDCYRSLPFVELISLFEIEAIEFHSLQKQTGTLARSTHPNLLDRTDELQDFADTAAYMSSLDLIITVDTAVAHLAGALAIPTWTLLPHAPDWRWLLNRCDSPWYPTMKLFRQARLGDWQSVLAEIILALTV